MARLRPAAVEVGPSPGGSTPMERDGVAKALALLSALAWIVLFTVGAESTVPVALALALGGVLTLRSPRYETARLALTTAVVAVLMAVPALVRLWPAPLLLALAVVLAVSRSRAPWLARGELGGRVAGWTAAVVALAGAALIAWWAIVRPDLSDAPLPRGLHPVLLAVGFAGWASLNALAEEAYFRGALQHVLDSTLGRRSALVMQAVAFGFMHRHGFPGGWSGVALATAFGLMTGLLRRRAGGLLAPWAAHLGADLVIAGILWAVAR